FYGNDVAVDGNTIVVGITHDHTLGLDAGAAYTYAFNGTSWVEAKIFASDGKAYDVFGQSVAVSGTFLVAGAYGDDDSPAGSQQLFKGAAYVFEKNGAGAWIQKAKLVDPNGTNQDYFGTQVAIAGSTVILGNEELPSAFGHAHAYRRNPTTGAWKLLADFQSSDVAPGDAFGIAVSARGKSLMVGAFGDDGVAPNSGSIYFYDIEAICPTAP
ncbi:MAG TPA: hypothetical protein VE404_00620, partial [Verrucomicrobiae bacterium]|nr:hypothetical protein [Verrucomicrobiae bacterium]